MSEKIELEKPTVYEQVKQAIAKDVGDNFFSHAEDIGESTITIDRIEMERIVEMTMGRLLLEGLVNTKKAMKEVK